MDRKEFENAIKGIYAAVERLTAAFPGRKFTPDGVMVGSIGEAFGAEYYQIKLHENSVFPRIDGEVEDTRQSAQIKATQGNDGVFIKEPDINDLLLVLRINQDGSFEQWYNGPAKLVWDNLEELRENRMGEKWAARIRLVRLQKTVNQSDQIPLRPQTSKENH